MEPAAAPRVAIDHLVVTAADLDAGAAAVAGVLGVPLAPGGAHARMGTHNRLLRLGDACYLEVIAPDLAAPAPGRPRWFALDARPAGEVRLATWVARVDAPGTLAALAARLPEPLGAVEPMSRGALQWQITIPADGVPPLGGAAPALIEWSGPDHPASRLPDGGCRLRALTLVHPQAARLQALLGALALSPAASPAARVPVQVEPGPAAALIAEIDTPRGTCRLGPDPIAS